MGVGQATAEFRTQAGLNFLRLGLKQSHNGEALSPEMNTGEARVNSWTDSMLWAA